MTTQDREQRVPERHRVGRGGHGDDGGLLVILSSIDLMVLVKAFLQLSL